MEADARHVLETPHPDVECRRPRPPVSYHVAVPDAGVTATTGLALIIRGYAALPSDDYDIALRRYIASRYNLIAVAVEYFGARMKRPRSVVPSPQFFVNLKRHYGIEVTVPTGMPTHQLLPQVLALLNHAGIKKLHDDCAVLSVTDEYQSFGVLPALDHLQVMHRLLTEFPAIDRRRVFALGDSYGAYVVLLLLKLAPKSFRGLFESSGFVRTSLPDLWGNAPFRGIRYGVECVHHEPNVWNIRGAGGTRFLASHAAIRDAGLAAHLTPTSTLLYSFHGVDDQFIPIAEKSTYHDRVRQICPARLDAIGPDRLDGKVFKTTLHGMGASFFGLFDLCMARYRDDPAAAQPAETTDFDLQSRYSFPCADRRYDLSFDPAAGPVLTIG